LAASLESIKNHMENKSNNLIYEIEVSVEYKENAKKALKKMIEIAEK
jgi:quinolinate synthase